MAGDKLMMNLYDGRELQKGDILSVILGGAIVFIIDHKIINPVSQLSKSRVSKKVHNGYYELTHGAHERIEMHPRYMLKKVDLFEIFPNVDPRTFVGVITDPTPHEKVTELLTKIQEAENNPNICLLIRRVNEDKKVESFLLDLRTA